MSAFDKAMNDLEKAVSRKKKSTRIPKARFKVGDKVRDLDADRRGIIGVVGSYDDYQGLYKYRVMQSDGSYIWWDGGSNIVFDRKNSKRR